MHFITGGAFNGKRAWVKENYPDGTWISAYQGDSLVEQVENTSSLIVVVEGLEMWIREIAEKLGLDAGRDYFSKVLDSWLKWEQQDYRRKLIVIGTDITKGIVPIDQSDRNWRDLTGWVYQDFVSKSEYFDVIWYGLNQRMKGEG